jgi:hypothetical protein
LVESAALSLRIAQKWTAVGQNRPVEYSSETTADWEWFPRNTPVTPLPMDDSAFLLFRSSRTAWRTGSVCITSAMPIAMPMNQLVRNRPTERAAEGERQITGFDAEFTNRHAA